MYSWVMKYSPATTPKSNTGTMFEWTSPACIRASSMNCETASLSRASSERRRLSTKLRVNPSTPATSATNSSDIPPSPRRSTSR